MNRRIQELRDAGVSIWLDTLSRELIEGGRFDWLIRERGVTGATSNPTIFERALTGSSAYDPELEQLAVAGSNARSAFFRLALADVRAAAGLLLPTYERSGGGDGFVSFEVTPDLADDASATIDQALAIARRLELPNTMIKVPATDAGVVAIERLTALGINVNVTLLFSLRRYEQVVNAYLRGLEGRLRAGHELAGINSVASFFVSRLDAKADPLLAERSPLRGRVAIANAEAAHGRRRRRFSGERWAGLRAAGASEQRLLWASTGTKDAGLSDVHYVEGLIAPDVINTMPEATLAAFADHGRVGAPLTADPAAAERRLAGAEKEGVRLERITAELEREGIAAFAQSYRDLLGHIEAGLAAASPRRTIRSRGTGPSPRRRSSRDRASRSGTPDHA